MKGKRLKPLLLLLVTLSLCFTLAGSAFAFNDIKNDPERASIEQLKKEKIVFGDGKDRFSPKAQMSVAAAVALIVKAMDLNIDHIRFIKEPKASDYFTKVKDNAWYAQAFIYAHLNGLEIPKDIDPNAKATREQFAHWLYQAIETKGEYAWIEIYIMINDEAQINKAYMTSIQRLLIAKIATLDSKQNFRPKAPITRSEAAGMVNRAREFVKNTKPIEPLPDILKDEKVTPVKVNDEVVKVTVSANAPHPGYGIEIVRIEFEDGNAIISYRPIMPDPSAMYAQVITEVSDSAYISAKYNPVLGAELHPVWQKQETDQGTKLVPYASGEATDADPASLKKAS